MVAVKELQELFEAAFAATHRAKNVNVSKSLCCHYATKHLQYTTGDSCSPVVSFDKVVLHEDLVHSHHQNSIDIILYANTGSH